MWEGEWRACSGGGAGVLIRAQTSSSPTTILSSSGSVSGLREGEEREKEESGRGHLLGEDERADRRGHELVHPIGSSPVQVIIPEFLTKT